MDPKRLFWARWWTFGSLEQELKEKKFAEWERPREDGEISNLLTGDPYPDVEGMEKEGFVFSEWAEALEVTEDTTQGDTIIEFVE